MKATNKSQSRKSNPFIWLVAALIFCALIARSFQTPSTVGEDYIPAVYASMVSLLPPVVAIVLALITKEVYSSLCLGILTGGLLYSNGNLELTLNTMLFHEGGGMVTQLGDYSHVCILIFVAALGMLVMLMNRAGGSAAFGDWASKHIKSRVGAQLASVALGVLIFVDDGFNCMTVGTIMHPITDRFRISRAKLAYIIDCTAAPICIIAPVSSWAAGVSYSLPEDMDVNGFTLFLKTIPYNLYAFGTLVMLLCIIIFNVDFGAMKKYEAPMKAGTGAVLDASATKNTDDTFNGTSGEMVHGRIMDLVVPVVVLIACCIMGMIYTGGFYEGQTLIDSFANADGARSLMTGSIITLIFTFFFYIPRKVISFEEFWECIPGGWRSFISPMVILILAWTLSGMIDMLGARVYIHDTMEASAAAVKMFLPFIIYIVAVLLAFSTGTSWGTFSILIPIVCNVFNPSEEMFVISIAACLAGAVCGDHCSPISDTTIMSSAGARAEHIIHVETQIPYAVFVSAISAAGYLVAGVIGYTTNSHLALISLPMVLCVIAGMIAFMGKRMKNR